MLALLPTTTALLALLSAPRPVPTARARPVALSIATWGELEARLPSSLAPEPLVVDAALARDCVDKYLPTSQVPYETAPIYTC